VELDREPLTDLSRLFDEPDGSGTITLIRMRGYISGLPKRVKLINNNGRDSRSKFPGCQQINEVIRNGLGESEELINFPR
jgi:hypothetical protein